MHIEISNEDRARLYSIGFDSTHNIEPSDIALVARLVLRIVQAADQEESYKAEQREY